MLSTKTLKKLALGAVTFLLMAVASALVVGQSTANADPANVGKVALYAYGHNAPGVDDSSDRNREYFWFKNVSGEPLNIEGWFFHDAYQNGDGEYSNGYTFSGSKLPDGHAFKDESGEFVMPVGGAVILYNGQGVDTTPGSNTAAVYRNFKHHFNNAGDNLYLRDGKSGTVVIHVRYDSYSERLPVNG